MAWLISFHFLKLGLCGLENAIFRPMVLGCLCRIFRFGAHFPGFSQDFPVLHMIFEV